MSSIVKEDKVEIVKSSGSWRLYVAIGAIVNISIWGVAFLYLKIVKPVYTSQMALNVPGSGSGINVNLPEIGQATSSTVSSYGSPAQDPRANYQYIATSEPVLDAAAAEMGIPSTVYDKPKIKLVDNTTLIQMEFSGRSPEEAQQKALVLYKILSKRLYELRNEEISRRDEGIETTLSSARQKLEKAQTNLSNYKTASGLSSTDQISNLSTNIEQLRKQRAEVMAQLQQSTNRLRQLSSTLNLSPKFAASAFVLQSDPQFQLNLKDYSDATATLTVLAPKLGENHPTYVQESSKQQASRSALLERSISLLGEPLNSTDLARLNLLANDSGAGKSGLFKDLIALQADREGLSAQAQELDTQIVSLEERLQGLAFKSSKLESLKRETQIAEAVFASTLARLDLGKSDIFTAYPLLQIIVQPGLADKPVSPQPKFVFLGAAAGSLLVTTGIVLLGIRQQRSRRKLPQVLNF
ncbi:GumC family protein [Tumidithrix helvetica]|uniref:GumC family protein n=1 Tax=Tumidithrix helvetica TaxID=3457545 RepID=UPI003CC5CC44